uniref:RING-type E3 ubiquitin transferase n=1 Tax=Fagus sylvatica TaxID=28930 RepID=A0A2N9GID7_FAGSY
MERDNARKEAEELRRKLAEAFRHMPQFFSEFLFSEIEEATQGFDESLKIGQGGYGSIYKGLLRQTEVAIKRLQSQGSQGPLEFQMEVRVLSQLRHPNLVKLIGSCPETFALIYEYLPNGSLEDRLNRVDNSPPLSWKTRIRIATELCSVLVYLHSNKPHIVHGDLKPSNILLDLNFVSKLSDFGICRELTIKSDVYSFGIILLQLLTNKPAFFIANEVKHALKAGNFKDLLDPLAGDWPIELAQELAGLALWCSHKNRKSRPDLRSDIWKVLQPMRDSCGASILIPTGS